MGHVAKGEWGRRCPEVTLVEVRVMVAAAPPSAAVAARSFCAFLPFSLWFPLFI